MKPDIDKQTEQQRKVEQFVAKVFKQQPLRVAPHDLQTRVLRELQRRATLPWWRQSFLHWPASMQALFVAAALVTAKIVLLLATWINTQLLVPAATLAQPPAWWRGASTLYSVGRDMSIQLTNMVPVSWLYGVGVCVAVLYLVLLGIGATAYKTLFLTR